MSPLRMRMIEDMKQAGLMPTPWSFLGPSSLWQLSITFPQSIHTVTKSLMVA